MNKVASDTMKIAPAINPGAAAASTVTGRTIDTLGYGSITFALQSGTVTDGTHTGTVFHSDTLNGGALENAEAVPAGDLKGSAVFVAADDNVVKKIGAVITKRYMRVDQVVTGSPATGAVMGAVAILGEAAYKPVK